MYLEIKMLWALIALHVIHGSEQCYKPKNSKQEGSKKLQNTEDKTQK